MKVLITGAAGCTASSLIPLLEKNKEGELFLTDLGAAGKGNYVSCDLTDPHQVTTLLETIRPDQIYHLAGSFSNNYETDYNVNVLSTKNIFEGCLSLGLKCRTLLIGSAAEYGVVAEDDNPVRESHPLNPVSTYGLTKVYQTLLMRYYLALYNIDVVMARTFNLLGRGMSNRLFVGRLYEQIDQYKAGMITKITVGNLQNRRDYLRVEEAVKYYLLIMERGCAGEIYNVGSGESVKLADLLENILKENDLSSDVVVQKYSNNVTKFDINDIYADMSSLRSFLENSNKCPKSA